ncbi:MAG: hypothetical protein HQ464_11795, partial [Planctomycetes bacterium]|nr:hypothetical protein [Planctomycetota bacterium]
MSTFERMLRVLSGRDGDEASRVAASLRPTETRRQRIAGKKGRASKRSAAVVQSERLEQRLALTIGIYTGGTTGGGPTPWAVITSDNADNVYVQQVATVAQNLIVADNPSFNSYQTIPAIDALTTVYATNGTNVSVAGVQSTERDPLRTTFLLSKTLGTSTLIGPITGSVGYGGNTWSFTNGGSGGGSLNFLLTSAGATSDPSLIFPISGQFLPAGGTGGADSIGILWSSPPTQAVGIGPPVIGSVNYPIGTVPFSDFGVRPSAGFLTTVNLPVTSHNPGGMIPGTLSGLLTVSGFQVDFRNNNLFTTAATGIAGNQLLFGNNGTPSTTGVVIINQGTPAQRTQQVTGYVDLDAGVVYLEFRNGVTLQDPGPVSISANYAVYNQDARSSELTFSPGQDFSRELYVDLLTPDATLNIQSPILQTAGKNGLSLSATNVNIDAQVKSINRFDVIGSTVDRNAQSTTATARAVVSTAGTISGVGVPAGRGGQGYDPTSLPLVSISGGGGTGATATVTILNGVIFGITVTNPGSGYTSIPTVTIDPPPVLASLVPLTPQVEQLNFNAAVAATSYDLRIGDDPNTFGIDRGRLFVSPTGSLSGALSGSAAGATTPASSLFVQADTSDLLIEGTVYATSQSYLMRSPAAAQALAPFLFSTTSVQSSAETGLIRGGRVAITLANDADTPEQGSALASTVNLRTQVDSLRIKAATRTGSQLSGPFPYELSISDVDDISFDAVAASSNAIALIAAGNISFSSTLATAGDLSIAAGGDFTVSAPLSTSRGKIAISAANVTVNNSIRVLDPPEDSTVDDITLTATGGNLSLNGAVSAVNNVRLIQRNKADFNGKIFGPSRVVAQGISVEAEGSADVRTDVVTLAGRAVGDFSVDELNDITITSLRSLGFVTLRAGGTDPGAGSPMSPNPIALTATLQDVVALQTSAPKGSVNILSNTARALTLGNPTTLAAGTATSMQAAGSVLIRSTAGLLTVADAPLGGGSAMAVRVATTANLPGTYLQNTPGQFASTLTGSKAPLSIDGVVLRVGDRVLLKNQTNGPQNGVYTVTVAGSVGRAWKLTRSVDADTSAELPVNTFVQVGEGLNAAGKVFSLAYSPTFGTSPIVAILSPNQPNAARVRVATTAVLPAIYNSGAGTITASAPGAIPAIDGVSLVMGDRVLVRLGTTGSAAANGVYEVTSMGGGGSSWVLTRALDPDTLVTIQMGYFATTEGSFRASATGQAFLLAYNPLGNDPMSVNPMAGSGRPVTNIGTEDINSLTTFVVSSTAGTNAAAGSLGKILQLRQANDTSSSTLNPAQTMS